jgi:four helix bundle protein
MIESYCTACRDKQKFDLARQLFRAGTSIGANVWEAQDPESRADFIHKMKIAAKEARETLFWLLRAYSGFGIWAPSGKFYFIFR